MSDNDFYLKGRASQEQGGNRFSSASHTIDREYLEYCLKEEEIPFSEKTQYTPVYPKSIVNKINSPDVGMSYSMNPYQGCEHGCIYCYARNSHEFWGYGPGVDFEQKILVKNEAASLLEAYLLQPSRKASTVVMSGNTDCYQPAERRFKLTRSCLEVFLKYRHPVSIITKNSLLLRDLDLLEALNNDHLISVTLSVTTLNEKIRQVLEPRTATAKKRLLTIEALRKKGIPVNVMVAPVIPAINSQEILQIAKACSEAGAMDIGFTTVRLNGALGRIFTQWLQQHFPDRANKVLQQIRECHAGNLNDSRFGIRNKGDGVIAKQIHQLIALSKKKYFPHAASTELNTSLFKERQGYYRSLKGDQLRLF